MSCINHVVLSGNLTRNAGLVKSAAGTQVLSFGIAVNEWYWDNKAEKGVTRPNFFECVVFGKRAESLAGHLVKGVRVTVDGKLRWSQWERDGQKRNRVEVIVDNIDFVATTPKEQSSTEQEAQSVQDSDVVGMPNLQDYMMVSPVGSIAEEDIPF